ncbi:hypothetical protein GCM10027586_00090 [Kineococcus gypseus]
MAKDLVRAVRALGVVSVVGAVVVLAGCGGGPGGGVEVLSASRDASASVVVQVLTELHAIDAPTAYTVQVHHAGDRARTSQQPVLALVTPARDTGPDAQVVARLRLEPGEYDVAVALRSCGMRASCPDDPASSDFSGSLWECSVRVPLQEGASVRVRTEDGPAEDSSAARCTVVPDTDAAADAG